MDRQIVDRAFAIFGRVTGSVWAVLTSLTIVFGAWASGHWAVADAIATAATFVMVFGLQRAANANTEALHAKIDELVRAVPEASDEVRGIEP